MRAAQPEPTLPPSPSAPRFVDGASLAYALWRRLRYRTVWVAAGLAVSTVVLGAGRSAGASHVILAMLAFPVLVLALAGMPHMLRDPLVKRVVTVDGSGVGSDQWSIADCRSPGFRDLLAIATLAAVSDGNDAELLANGDETFPALWRDLRAARHSITVQIYYLAPGHVTDVTFRILAERARAGVHVCFLYDAFGAEDLPDSTIEVLRRAGVDTAVFHPMRWYALDNTSHRLHARGVVIDGAIGYSGGFGLDDKWLGSGARAGEWREANVRVVGPAAEALQAAFVSAWTAATGDVLVIRPPVVHAPAEPRPVASGTGAPTAANVTVAVVNSPVAMGSTAAERLLAFAIASARTSLWISNAYFVPTAAFESLLLAAARRGVDVRILTNGASSDVRTTWRAGRSYYARLLRAGIRIYEYRTTIHAKTLAVDGAWGAVTTINFDNRSLAYNNEIAVVLLDAAIGRQMHDQFAMDISRSDEILHAAFAARPWQARVSERLARVGARLL